MSGQWPVSQSHGYLAWRQINPLYETVVQATEESVVDVLVTAEDTPGPGSALGRGRRCAFQLSSRSTLRAVVIPVSMAPSMQTPFQPLA